MQVDVLNALIKDERPMCVYDFDLKDDKDFKLPQKGNDYLKNQNQLHTQHFRKLNEMRDRLSILLSTEFK